jgi:anti-sigma B factor antagonist
MMPGANDEQTIRLEGSGELTLVTAQEWKPRLLEALGGGRAADVELSNVTEMDLPALQLLISARRTFASRALAFTITDPAGIFTAACNRAGIEADGGEGHA